jgi:hypothetical protein
VNLQQPDRVYLFAHLADMIRLLESGLSEEDRRNPDVSRVVSASAILMLAVPHHLGRALASRVLGSFGVALGQLAEALAEDEPEVTT